MMILNNPGIHKIIQALCWTLIHSLWQGLIVAIIGGVVLLCTRKSRPVLRYNALIFLLLLFVIVSLGTFCNEMVPVTPISKIAGGGSVPSIAPLTITSFTAKSVAELNVLDADLAQKLIDFLDRNATVIVSIWFFIFSIKSLRAAAGLAYVSRIRNHRIHDVGTQWQWHLRQLAQKIGTYERIELIASEIVRVPLVTGFFKPMIVVPLGFLTSLPIDQVEAILLHELAHVKRRDYLVNILQTVAGTLFFFNPAVLWVSSLISEEREHCCDDLAIQALGDKSSFINALVSFQEYNLCQSQQAVAFAGRRNHLLDRIKRIIYNNNKQLNAMEKLFVTASFIVAAGILAAFAPAKPIQPLQVEKSQRPTQRVVSQTPLAPEKATYVIPRQQKARVDTLRNSEKGYLNENDGIITMNFERNKKKYNVVLDGSEIIYLKVDGQSVAKEKMGYYKAEIDEVMLGVKQSHADAMVAKKEAEVMRIQAQEAREQTAILRQQAAEIRIRANENRNQNKEIQADLDGMKRDAQGLRINSFEMRQQADEIRNQALKMRTDAERERAEAFKYLDDAKWQRQKASFFKNIGSNTDKRKSDAANQIERAEKVQEKTTNHVIESEKIILKQPGIVGEIVEALEREGIIDNKDTLSYRLGKYEFIVNGRKTSDAVHDRFKARFVKDREIEMVYHSQGINMDVLRGR